jgi:hypothetical protein
LTFSIINNIIGHIILRVIKEKRMFPDKPTDQPETINPPAESSATPTPQPIQPVQPGFVPVPTVPPPAKSGKGLLIAIISILVALIIAAGVVLAIVLLNNNKDDEPKTEDPKSSSQETPTSPTVSEKVASCVAEESEGAVNITLKYHFNSQDLIYKISGDIKLRGLKITEEMLPDFESAIVESMGALPGGLNFTTEITPDGTALITVTSKDGGTIKEGDGSAKAYNSETLLELRSQCSEMGGVFSES